MSLQELLTKDYSKKPQLLLVRFTIIGGNLLIFLYCSGWHFDNRFGPIITAPLSYETVSKQMKSFSSLDMMALLMALLVVVRQLDFRRPEIDSYNEIVYLPAQESKSILALMLFSIFKFYYQFPRGGSSTIGWEGFILDPYLKLNKNFEDLKDTDYERKKMIFFNLLLILSSTICFFHSLTFKYVIKNTERNMILTVLDVTNFLVKLITILDMILVIFIQDTKYLGILLLVVIVFDIFRITRISYLDKSRSGYTLSMRDYISSVKWISMFVFGIVLHGSLGAYFLVKFDLDKKSTIYKGVSNCLLFERNSRPEGSKVIFTLINLVVALSLLELISKIKEGASLEVFDIHNSSDMVKALKRLEKKISHPVTETSYFYEFFLYKFNSILGLDEKHLFTNTFGFKKKYMKVMAHESAVVHKALDKFRSHFIATLTGNKKLFAQLWMIFKWHAKASLRVTINFYSAFFFLFYIKKPLYFPTMCFSVLCWNILSIITTNSAVMVLASIILIYPFYIVDHLQVVVTNLEVDNVEKVLAPFTVYTYPIIIVLISLYMAFTMTENEDGVSTLFSEEILKLSEKNKFNDNTYLRYIQAITDFVKDPLERIYRYFTLLMAIFTALHFISILSTILVIFGLILIWKTDGDKKYWKWFTCYTVFHIIIKQLGHYIVKEEMYNTEFMALIGIIGVEKEPDSIYSLRRLMLLDYILIFLSCTWYWRIQFKETQELLQKDQSNGLKGLKNLAFSHVNTNILRIFRAAYTFASMMVNYYSIWIYHISANLVLLSEPRDVVTIVMLSLEILTTFVHIAIWKKSGVHPYKSVYRVWAPNFYLVVLYALVRYLTFFLQYIHARDFYVEVLNLAGFEGKKIIEEKIENMLQVNSYSYQYYVKSYFKLLLLVSVAVYTRNSLLSVIEANDKDAEEKLNRLLKESLSKDSNQVLKQITGTKPDLSSRLSVSSRKSDMYSSKYIEQDDQLECYQKELRKVKRKAHPFILIYMIFKGLFIILISFQLNTKLTLFKFFMIVTYVFNIRRIIIEICSLCTEFQMMELAELRLRYFFLTFLTNKKWRLSEDSHSQFTQAYTEKLEKIDLAQNKAYYETFLKKMEERLLQINRVYWGMNTFPLLFWLIFLSTLNYLIPDSSFIERFKLDWIFGLEPKTWSDWSIFSIELFQIHGVLISLYLEYMLLSFYLDCRNELVDMDSASIQDLLKVMTIKFRCMVDLRENNIKSDRQSHQLDLIFKKYLRALKWNPAVRDRTIENSTLPLSKRNSASSIRNDAKNSISIKPMEVISEEETSEVDEMKTDKIEKDQDSPQPEPVEVDSEEMESEESEEEEEEEDVADLVLPDKISKSKKPSKRFSVLKPVEDEEDDYETELKKFEEEENLQKFNFSKKNTLEGSQIDGLKKLVSRTITNSSKDHSVSYMTEMTTKEEMLILMFKNRYRYLFSKSLTAMQYAISRIVWIPLFYPLVSSINVLTICFFILFMVKTKARVRIFIEEARDNVNMVIYYLMSMWLQAFFHQQLYELRQADSSEHATFYRTFIDDPAMSALKDFILPVNRDTLTICFYWYFIICVSIACLPFFLWFTTLSLFRHYSHKTDTYHYYLLDSVRRRNLVIDYVKWKKSSWHFINFYYKTALTNPVEVFAMIIMVLFVLDWCSMFIPLLFMTMVIILMEHFRSDHIDNEASRQFNLSRQKRILELYRTVFWITMYFRHGIDFLGRLGFFQGYKENKEAFMENFSGTLFLLFTIATTYILSDLLVTEEFIRESFKIKTYRELKVNMASLCKAYEINENKVYYRVVQMIKKGHLDEISSNIIDSKIDFDCSAYLEEPDIKKIIESSFDKILRKNLGFWLSFKLKMTDSINSMLVKHVEKYIRQDMMILFDSFRIRNTHLIKPDEINLEDYFDDNMGFFFKLYDKVNRFYTLLAYEDEPTKKQFDTAAQAFMAESLSKLKRMPSEFPAKPLSTLGGHRASINQKKMNLKAATNVLFKAITSTTEYASTTNVDSYKVEFKKKGFIQCFYGKTKVILFNLKTSDRIFESSSFYEFSIFPIIYYLLNILNDRFDKVTAYVIILLHIFYGGLTNIIIVGLLVFTVFIEESPGRNTAWLLVYASLTLRMILKRFYFVYTDEYTAGFFLGHLTSNEDLLSIIIVVINIQELKYFSPINKACSDIENPGQAIVRMTLNDDFKAAIGRIIFPIMRKKESLNKYLCKLDLTEFEGVSPQDFRFVLVRQFIKNKLMLRDFKTNVMYQCQRLLKVLRYDYIKISSEQMDSFFFRNFSYNLRKKGGSYLTMVSCLFACIILFILMFFPTLGGIQAGVASFLFENTVTAFTVLNFTIYLSFFILHVYFDNTKTKDTAGLKDKDYKLKLIEGQFQDVTYEHAHKKPVAKLKNAVKLVQNSNNMMKQVKADFNLWTDNPLFYLFLSNIVLWIYMNISVYFWHSYHGNIKASQKEGLSQFICEPKDRIREPGESKVTQCRNYSERIESQIFYLLNTLYIILCMYQIRDGKELVISKITDYSSSFKQMFFSLYRMIPLMLEAECTFKFCATYTCLEFSDYILVKEIEQIMQKAKILQINRMETKTGKQLVRRSQIGLCCMVLSIVIGVLCLPIYIFYNDTSVNFYPIESANLTVDLYYDRKTPIMNLLSMTKLRENRILDKDLDADLIRVLSDKGVLRKYSFEQIRVA